MNKEEFYERLKYLKNFRDISKYILTDKSSIFYKDELMKILLKKAKNEIERCEELIYNNEV